MSVGNKGSNDVENRLKDFDEIMVVMQRSSTSMRHHQQQVKSFPSSSCLAGSDARPIDANANTNFETRLAINLNVRTVRSSQILWVDHFEEEKITTFIPPEGACHVN